jgi:hypothetical protein
MKKLLLFLAILFGIAFFTSPSELEHKALLKAEYNKLIDQYTRSDKDSNFWEKAGNVLGKFFGRAIVEKGVDYFIEVEDYTFFSLGKVTLDNNTEIVSVGIFGKVFITDELERKIRESNITR